MKYDHKCFKALFTASTGSVYSLNWRFFGETGSVCWQYRQKLAKFYCETGSVNWQHWRCLFLKLAFVFW
jgi:hypothetical protein